MKPSRTVLSGLLLLVVAAGGRAQGASPGDLPIAVTRLGERVLVLDCLDVNVVAVATDSGVVVIDTGRSPGLIRAMAAVIEREFGRGDVRYVINTHGHPDHCAGNQVFPRATIVAHEACPEFMRHNRADALRTRLALGRRIARAEAAGEPSDPRAAAETRARRLVLADLQDGYVLTPPTRTCGDRLTLALGDRDFELCFAGAAHTNNDLLVYVPQEQLLLAGDLFCAAGTLCFTVDPLVDARRLADELARLLAGAAGLETVVPGHGAPFGRAALVRLHDALRQKCAEMAGRRSAAALLAGIAEAQGGDAALDRYRRLLAAGGENHDFAEEELYRLANRLWWRGQAAVAARMLEMSLERFPRSALLHDDLGNIRLEAGDTAAALASYRRSLALFPENLGLREFIGALEDRELPAGGATPAK